MIRRVYDLFGVLQGVGFRPTLFRLAAELGVGGSAQNRTDRVRLTLDGARDRVETFLARLQKDLPARAELRAVDLVSETPIPPQLESTVFRILESDTDGLPMIQIPADLALCKDCRAEILDPAQPRYRYPFTTCTHCGPRYTVVQAMPYDRSRTTLSAFPLCERCRAQYEDPNDRRFHAETIACPACGPSLRLLDADGRERPGDPILETRRLIAEGQIVALRGIGGFQLAADPFNRATLARLRQRKHRPDKPFAVMAATLADARPWCRMSDAEADTLSSPAAPIVILRTQPADRRDPALPVDLLCPDTDTLGILLPASPLHVLLMRQEPGDSTPPFRLLLLTSGNRGREPIATGTEEALRDLRGIADAFLTHDREITLRCDDSICVEQPSGIQIWRRARGYAPEAIFLPRTLPEPVLAMGAELKNTLAVGFDDRMILSPHVGDIETPGARDGLEQISVLFPEFLRRAPQRIAVDLHPDMHSTRLGLRIARERGLPVTRVQHHHAHALACLAENGLTEGLALVWDGTGLGPDGLIWGAELLEVTPHQFRRLATFAPVPLPGGDAAVLEPRRQLFARWIEAGLDLKAARLATCGITEEMAAVWRQQIVSHLNTPRSHAAGRVFDAVAVALGCAPERVTYEGQAAIRLEAAALRHTGAPASDALPFATRETDGLLEINWTPMFRVLEDAVGTEQTEARAADVHRSLALAAGRMIEYAFSRTKQRVVALSGGVFMNRLLTRLVADELKKYSAMLLVHHRLPPNDGAVSAGQIVACGA